MTLAGDAFCLVHDTFSPAHEAFFSNTSMPFVAFLKRFTLILALFASPASRFWCVVEGLSPEKRQNLLRDRGFLSIRQRQYFARESDYWAR